MRTISTLALILAQAAALVCAAAAASYDHPLPADLFDLPEAERTAHLALAECKPTPTLEAPDPDHPYFHFYQVVRDPNLVVDLTKGYAELMDRLGCAAALLDHGGDSCDVVGIRYLAKVLAAFWPGKKQQSLDGFRPSDARDVYSAFQDTVRGGLPQASIWHQEFINRTRSLAREMVYNETMLDTNAAAPNDRASVSETAETAKPTQTLAAELARLEAENKRLADAIVQLQLQVEQLAKGAAAKGEIGLEKSLGGR